MSVSTRTDEVLTDGRERAVMYGMEADESITPGHIVEYDSGDSDIGLGIKHSTSGGAGAVRVALTKAWGGDAEDSTDPIDDAYSDGDAMRVAVLPEGARWRALIAAGENISVGDFLVSAGDGTLQQRDSTSPEDAGAIFGVAREAGNETADFRLEVEVTR